MASKDGRIQDFVPRGKKRPNPVMLHDENKNDHHADDSNDCQQQQQKTQQQEQVPPEALLPSSTGCLVCGVDDDHAKLLLCEDCNGEFHTYCLTPKLDTVPEYDWFCGASFFSHCIAYLPLTMKMTRIYMSFFFLIYSFFSSCCFSITTF